jgi:hypothetical protein
MPTVEANSKKLGTSRIFWSIVWALAIIASAFLFKGSPSQPWIESGLVIGALVFVLLKP